MYISKTYLSKNTLRYIQYKAYSVNFSNIIITTKKTSLIIGITIGE